MRSFGVFEIPWIEKKIGQNVEGRGGRGLSHQIRLAAVSLNVNYLSSKKKERKIREGDQ